MPTIVKIGILKLIIATDDHLPPHIHAIYGRGLKECDVNMRIYLEDGRTEMIKGTFSKNQLQKIQSMYENNLDHIIKKWNQIHGSKK